MTLPEHFWWGCTSSSVGAEGVAPAADWSRWEREGRAPRSGEGSGFGTNHADDLAGLAELGLTHQRITVEWARIAPRPNQIDGGAIEHYRQILRSARDAGVEPWVTLVHGSLPGWFGDDERGFRDERGVKLTWARHVDRVAEALDDLVAGWVPIEDPVGMALRGHLLGTRPPGRSDPEVARDAVAGTLDAVWEAWRLLRSGSHPVMAVFGLPPITQVGSGAADEARLWEQVIWSSWIQAVRDGVLRLPGRAPLEREGLADAFDLIGIAYDHPVGITADGAFAAWPADGRTDGSGFAPLPEELGMVLRRVAEELPDRPLVVASTGVATTDDDWRSQLMAETIDQVEAAVDDGVDVRGLSWHTAIDGYEWLTGFDHPRGLLTPDRNPKPSFDRLRPYLRG
ncbi:MAG: family 1 glycosylhydrolase [Acidimicrobiia bacterium]|nr:family 1 glycosylhydrolase [Acidimicrobiia bacterium]